LPHHSSLMLDPSTSSSEIGLWTITSLNSSNKTISPWALPPILLW
jgi:hypothetical protein